MDGTRRFTESFASYVNGFGNLNQEFWLNLNNIHRLTMQSGANTTLRVDMGDFDSNTRFAKYSTSKSWMLPQTTSSWLVAIPEMLVIV